MKKIGIIFLIALVLLAFSGCVEVKEKEEEELTAAEEFVQLSGKAAGFAALQEYSLTRASTLGEIATSLTVVKKAGNYKVSGELAGESIGAYYLLGEKLHYCSEETGCEEVTGEEDQVHAQDLMNEATYSAKELMQENIIGRIDLTEEEIEEAMQVVKGETKTVLGRACQEFTVTAGAATYTTCVDTEYGIELKGEMNVTVGGVAVKQVNEVKELKIAGIGEIVLPAAEFQCHLPCSISISGNAKEPICFKSKADRVSICSQEIMIPYDLADGCMEYLSCEKTEEGCNLIKEADYDTCIDCVTVCYESGGTVEEHYACVQECY